MQDDATAGALPLHRRVRHGIRHPANLLHLVRFGRLRASGYPGSLAAFPLAVHVAGIDYKIAAVLAFLVSVANNFWWNRHWTFDARAGHAGFQAARFFTVSAAAFGFSYLVLLGLVEGVQLPEVLA